MKKRLITGAILLAVLIPLIIIESLLPAFQIIAAVFVCIGAWEMIRLFEKGKKFSWLVKIVIMISSLLIYLSGLTIWAELTDQLQLNQGQTLIKIFVDSKLGFALLMVAISLQLSLLVFSKDFDANDIGKSLTSSFYVGFGVASLLALRILGIRFIAYLFMITILTDVFAYVFGMLFGKHKMIERISPKKTWEGAIGGTIVATIAASLFAFLYGALFPGGDLNTIFDNFTEGTKSNPVLLYILIFVVTLITSIAGQIGDLVASRLKRTYDIKDFSNVFPGHGGFLDRFDSAIFASLVLLPLFIIISSISIL